MLTACSQSFLFWCNAFVWTYRQKMAGPDGNEIIVTGQAAHVPFITWLVQDEAVAGVLDCIKIGEDLNLEKSRDMGASWLVLALIDWHFLFKSNHNMGVVSRKESLVDSAGDMDSLFEKIRYIHRMLPLWMLPKIHSRYMHLQNLELNSTIAGESTNADVGRGGRKTFYFVDEAAVINNAQDIESSLSQNTPCQIWGSTPKGPNTQFHKRIKEKRGRLIQLPWWRHPEKSMGAHQIRRDDGRIKWTSPWYEIMCEKYSAKTIAQELDMDHGQSGDLFFDYTELERHRVDHVRPPEFTGDLIPVDEMTDNDRMEAVKQMDSEKFIFIKGHGRNPWRFWLDLEDGRPPQHYTYIFGADISNGSGNSNSVLTVLALEAHVIVAKWWDAFTSPEEMAVMAATAGIWFGGLRPPGFQVWENNGPGGIYGRKLVKMGYPSFYRQRAMNSKKRKKSPRWGWNSNNERKELLLGLYRDALASDRVINPCDESLDEAADYIYDASGSLLPSRLREELSGGRQLHGDHVIADALVVLGADEFGKQREAPARPPQNSFAWRQKQRRRRSKQEADPWRD